MSTEIQIPTAWRAALKRIQAISPGAVLAGGCLRDRDHEVPVKDLDFFVQKRTGKIDDLEKIAAAIRADGGEAEIDGNKVYPESDNRVVGVVDVKLANCPPIQIIVADWCDIPTLFSMFDYGVCQIAYDGRKFHRSLYYNDDSRKKRFRIRSWPTQRSFEQSVERYARFLKKYPGWKFSIGSNAQFHSGGRVNLSSEFVVKADMVTDPGMLANLKKVFRHG